MKTTPSSGSPTPPNIESVFKVTANGLGKRFTREWIFRNLNMELTGGNTFAVTGPNGSGKSTLLQVLSGMMPPSAGTLAYANAGGEVPLEDVYKSIAFAAPYMDLVEEFTLRELVRFHFRLKPLRRDIGMEDVITRMYLDGSADQFIGNFSSGMKQRVKLGLAFYAEAQFLLLDEPATNLDQSAFGWYRQELGRLPASSLVVIASNNPAEYPENAKILNILDHKR